MVVGIARLGYGSMRRLPRWRGGVDFRHMDTIISASGGSVGRRYRSLRGLSFRHDERVMVTGEEEDLEVPKS